MSRCVDRRCCIGGSDARVVMGSDETALVQLWREKRGEVEPEDLSDNLIVQLGSVTEELNRRWYQRNTGHVVRDVQKRISIQSTNGWRQRWMAWWIPMAPRSRPNSCCPGRSPRKPSPKSTWRNCSTICGSQNARSAVLSI